MMNIQKEREAFEVLQNPKILQRAEFLVNISAYAIINEYRDDLFTLEWVEELNFGWRMWKAAKAQAVPEANALLGATLDAVQKLGSGDFVLVPVIDIELAIEALDEAGEGESKYYAGCADGLRKALESLEKNNGN